ncbi:leucine--tRNA ligase [archaeon]|nr:leucine--tRNA ligase [archaeon]
MDFKKIEQKWQEKWEQDKVFKSIEDKKKKFYCLEMYPYPSSAGLHMGHALNYGIGDIYARFKRMNNFNVLYPMGFDSFGLPAENAAIKNNSHPKLFTESAIKNYIKQMKALGLSYDWDRTLMSHDPNYYKWNQYFFIKFLENGLASKKKSSVNWCPDCNTVLANEQVNEGKCWRHKETEVQIKQLEQWFLNTTKYADELLKDIEKLNWPERIKIMQKNWIGKSHGSEIIFKIEDEDWKIFTTRPDTLFGVTFMVISAQHTKLMFLVTEDQKAEVETFLKKLNSTKDEDIDQLEKEGVFTGTYAQHPLTNEKIPIYAGNFVLAEYGSGMIMAVPGHDKRDLEFAKKYDLPIKEVINDSNILINSKKFNGLTAEEAKDKITKELQNKNLGKKTIQFKIRDWLVSRQRYWGTPIPIIYCDSCNIVPVPEKDLPVILPEDVKFGEGNPLETNDEFLNVTCPKCGKNAKRETDTMDTFFDSSWYFLRYTDNKNNKKPFEKSKVDYWLPVDQYIGGAEHAVMHLIYARFFTKALRDLKFLNIDEPFPKLFNQGMLHLDGFVMSKSRGNVILPETVSEKYGIDTARLFLVSVASPDKDTEWNEKGVEGSLRFINKIFNYFETVKFGKSSKSLESKLNKTIIDIYEDIENFRYNYAVIKIRELFDSFEEEINKKDLESFIKILSPFCPHISEELWEKLGNKTFISKESWPKADKTKINKKFEEQEKISNNLINDIIHVVNIIKSKGKQPGKVYVYVIPKELTLYNKEYLEKKLNITLEIYSVADPKKHDPENKSKKAKPGKPALYVE